MGLGVACQRCMIWGASMFVFFLKAPTVRSVCLHHRADHHARICRRYFFCSTSAPFNGFVDGLCLTVIAALDLANVDRAGQLPADSHHRAACLCWHVIYWSAIRLSGRRFHDVQRANLELQFDNHALVCIAHGKDAFGARCGGGKKPLHRQRGPRLASAGPRTVTVCKLARRPSLNWLTQIAPKISRSTRAVNDMFDSLFDFAGLENGCVLKPNLQDGRSLTMLVLDLELQYAPVVALERQLQLRTRVKPGLKVQNSDPLLLKRLVGNLLSNALKNTRRGGVLLAVRRRQNNCRAYRSVGYRRRRGPKNTSMPSFRSSTEFHSPERTRGFGLGLAIVSGLEPRAGSPDWHGSRAPGRGSVFWVAATDLPGCRCGDSVCIRRRGALISSQGIFGQRAFRK